MSVLLYVLASAGTQKNEHPTVSSHIMGVNLQTPCPPVLAILCASFEREIISQTNASIGKHM